MHGRGGNPGSAMLVAVALAAAACGGGTADPLAAPSSTTTPTTTTSTTTTSTTTTTTTLPSGAPIIGEGDRGTAVEALQVLLNCAGYGTLETDGVFGAKTAGAVAIAQEAFGKATTGEPDDETFGMISRECERAEVLDLGGDGTVEVFGNAVEGDPDAYSFGVQTGSVVTLRADPAVRLAVTGEDGTGLSSEDGRLVYQSPAAGVATVTVEAATPTTYLLRIDLAPPGEGGTPAETTVVAGAFDPADWIGTEWSGDPPGGLVDYAAATDCYGAESDSPCHDYYAMIVARPGAFTGTGADNPVEAMAWLLRNTGRYDGDFAVWDVVDAVVVEVPIGDTLLTVCYPQGGSRNLVAWADLSKGTVTGAIRLDWVTREIEAIPPDRIVCVSPATGDQIAVGPGFG